MKVFISWSGETSFEVAKVLKEWIPCVIQNANPYFSSEDIEKGARWSTDIAKELETASFGILCITKDNLESQWLNFEAGALSKTIDNSKVCPLLFRLKPSEISDSPLLQFHMANIEKSEIYKLFKSINSSLGEDGHDEARLEKLFDICWEKMDEAFKKIKDIDGDDTKGEITETNNAELLEEMLELLRSQQMLLNNPSKILPKEYIEEVIHSSGNNRVDSNYDAIPKSVIVDIKECERRLGTIINIPEDVNIILKEYISNVHRLIEYSAIDIIYYRK